MLNRLICAIFFALSISTCERVSAFAMPSSKPLPQIIAQSQTIVAVSLVKYQSEISFTQSKDQEPSPIGATGPDTFTSYPLKPAGRYVFHVIKLIKGTAPATLHVNFPYILSLYYGGADLPIRSGNKLILFLQPMADGNLVPTDATVPFVPLTDEATASESYIGSAEENVYSLMLSSCSDLNVRLANTYILRTVVNPLVVAKLFYYINDQNLYTRDNVLTCMATNQQVTAIPRIAALDMIMEAGGGGAQSAIAFNNYQTSEALPYLNTLIFSPAYYTRLNAMFAIDRLANRSSISYLMLAVRDPDRQGIIQQSAYGMLHQLIPSLGEAYGSGYFALHRTKETLKLYAWWNDELLGKHLKPGQHPELPTTLPSTPAQLYPLLFIPDTDTRRVVAVKLSQTGNASSVPYLILALQDPDTEVAFTAYKTLHRLIPALGVPKTREDFDAYPAVMSQPVYAWWQDELLGKHLQK